MDRTADALIGHVLDGRYLVGPRIARGGMATVYEATDLRLERTVAVKVMHEALAEDEEFVRRFQREARSAARLAHQNVVAVFDTGDDDGTLFLVMEYVPGQTMRDLIRRDAPMSPSRALSVIEPVLGALGAAHDAGILHRDVKPENVLLAEDGRVKVADFGLARAINSETQHTSAGGVLIGTVSYLSPELVVNGQADARADVYAVGVLIYELLTGHKPHQADTAIQVAYKHVHEDIAPPSASTRGIPAYVDALVARATARDPARRPMDARVLLHQVQRVRNALDHGVLDDADLVADLTPTRPVDDEPTLTGQLPAQIIEPRERAAALPPVPRRSRRSPALIAVAAALTVLVALGGWYLGVARYTTAPGVLNLSEAAARVRLEGSGLSLVVSDKAWSETVARGRLIRTDPGPGDRVRKDGSLTAVVSLGPERRRVPDVRGKTLDEAQQSLDETRLAYGDSVERYHEKVAVGRVIGTDPAPGASLRRNTAVDVIVSRGPRPIRILSYVNKPAAAAAKSLEELGFQVDTTEANSNDVPIGRVVSQSPGTGTGSKGDVISLVVSKGPVLVAVPQVVRMGLAAARERLEEAGFEVSVREASLYIGVQYVVATDPAAGTEAPRGSTVVVSIV